MKKLVARRVGSHCTLQKRCKILISGLLALTVILSNYGRGSTRVGWAKNNRHNDLYNAKSHGKICGSLANPPPIRDFVNGRLVIEMA
ncbi:MAG: hypothetical protein SVP52_10025 [Chloroflexota bacterium]|nr:hypothetical protein [Chloroflexota bacterium]